MCNVGDFTSTSDLAVVTRNEPTQTFAGTANRLFSGMSDLYVLAIL